MIYSKLSVVISEIDQRKSSGNVVTECKTKAGVILYFNVIPFFIIRYPVRYYLQYLMDITKYVTNAFSSRPFSSIFYFVLCLLDNLLTIEFSVLCAGGTDLISPDQWELIIASNNSKLLSSRPILHS